MNALRSLCIRRQWVLAGLIGALVVGGVLGLRGSRAEEANGIAKAKSLSEAFRAAAKQVSPTVVKIRTASKPRRIESPRKMPSRPNPFKGTPFEDFFDDQMPGFGLPGQIPPRQGVGSGVIIDASGIILTNNHVVAGADEVLVELSDGRQLKATDIKTDEYSDLAVLRIQAEKPLPAATLGDSDAMEIGDWVLAIGNPFELDLTVSAGIISGKGRVLPSSKRANFLQTDAAINPGNSGGPLVNLDGEVVGINTAIASNSGGYQGVGFAIPINLAKWVTAQLVKTGTVERAYLGVAIGEVTDELARQLNVQRGKGVLVNEVYPDTPAAAAGFQAGDVIVTYASQKVHDPRELQEYVERSPLGSTQQVEIIRDGRAKTLSVKVASLPSEFGVASAPSAPRGKGGDGSAYESRELGMEVAELSAQVAEQLGYKDPSGVLIAAVDPDGVAAAAGIREGMLVLRVGRKPVASVAEFKAALENESLKDGVLLLIRTQQGNRFVVLKQS